MLVKDGEGKAGRNPVFHVAAIDDHWLAVSKISCFRPWEDQFDQHILGTPNAVQGFLRIFPAILGSCDSPSLGRLRGPPATPPFPSGARTGRGLAFSSCAACTTGQEFKVSGRCASRERGNGWAM